MPLFCALAAVSTLFAVPAAAVQLPLVHAIAE